MLSLQAELCQEKKNALLFDRQVLDLLWPGGKAGKWHGRRARSCACLARSPQSRTASDRRRVSIRNRMGHPGLAGADHPPVPGTAADHVVR